MTCQRSRSGLSKNRQGNVFENHILYYKFGLQMLLYSIHIWLARLLDQPLDSQHVELKTQIFT